MFNEAQKIYQYQKEEYHKYPFWFFGQTPTDSQNLLTSSRGQQGRVALLAWLMDFSPLLPQGKSVNLHGQAVLLTDPNNSVLEPLRALWILTIAHESTVVHSCGRILTLAVQLRLREIVFDSKKAILWNRYVETKQTSKFICHSRYIYFFLHKLKGEITIIICYRRVKRWT